MSHKQRTVVYTATNHVVKSAWGDVSDLVDHETVKALGERVNGGATLTITLPNGDFETFNAAHVVAVKVETYIPPTDPQPYGSSGASGVEFDLTEAVSDAFDHVDSVNDE